MHNRLTSLLILSVALGAVSPGVHAQSLETALDLAYRTNPTIRAERARQRATSEATKQAWANLLPQITASGSYDKINGDQVLDSTAFGNTTGPATFPLSFDLNSLATQVTGEQAIFSGFRNINALKQARARVRAGGAQLVSVEQDVLTRAATAYFDVVRDTEVFKANSNNVRVLLRQLDEANLRFEVGEVTRTDVAQAEARLAGARAQLTNSQAQLAVSRAGFVQLVGQNPETLEKAPGLMPVPETLEATLELGRVYAPAVLAAAANEQISSKDIAIAKGALSPTVSFVAQYQYAENTNRSLVSDERFAYGARASIPIFQGGRNISRIREARALNDADRQRIEEARRSVEAQITGAWEQLNAAKASTASAKKQVEANELALKGVRREAQLGARTTLDVLDAEQESLNSVVSLATAERNSRVATFTLLASAGILTLSPGENAE